MHLLKEEPSVYSEIKRSVGIAPLPTSAQVKPFDEIITDAILQLSVEPLFTCTDVTDPFPFASSITVAVWQFTTGGVLSTTVTVALHVALFPFISVTER